MCKRTSEFRISDSILGFFFLFLGGLFSTLSGFPISMPLVPSGLEIWLSDRSNPWVVEEILNLLSFAWNDLVVYYIFCTAVALVLVGNRLVGLGVSQRC